MAGSSGFAVFYAHLNLYYVNKDQEVKRGELIGISGKSAPPENWPHLHFGVIKEGGDWLLYSNSLNPGDLWLGGEASCFDPERTYLDSESQKLTHPIPCGEYYREMYDLVKNEVIEPCGPPAEDPQ